MHEDLQHRTVISTLIDPVGVNGGPVVFTTTGDKFIFTPANPVRLRKWGIIVQTDLVPATQCLLTLSKRPTAGSDTSRVAVDTLRTGTTNYVAGKGIYRDPYTASTASTSASSEPSGAGQGGTYAVTSGQADIYLIPGQEWVVDVTTAATTTGKGYIWIEYAELPITKPSGYGTTDAGTVSLTENYTRVAS